MKARAGIALFAALATMAVVALLVGGMVATSTLAQRSSALTHADAELGAAADFAIASALDPSLADLPLGVSQTINVGGGRTTSIVSATRLPRDVVWLVAESRTTGALVARRRVNLVARWNIPRAPSAPIVSRGHVRLGPLVVFASDTSPGADCRVPAGRPRVMIAPGAAITSTDSVFAHTDSSASDSTTFYLGAPLDTVSGITHVRGDTTIAGGRIDGILMVHGRVILTGSVTVTGLVIATGAIDTRGARLELEGALLSYETFRAGHFAVDLGEAVIRDSPCVVARAWRRILPLRAAKGRSWAEIF
jgi:hypothetical protein